jgi:glycosyltransferase involved in cell wall biosynthesis
MLTNSWRTSRVRGGFSRLRTRLWAAVAGVRSITFITPNQDMKSGGPYAIQQLAANLAGAVRVNLVVDQEVPTPLEGVRTVHAPGLRSTDVPDADAVVLYADAHFGEACAALPSKKGRRFVYFQGYAAIKNPAVIANLQRRWPVIASARWLVADARAYGCPAAFAPYGLDASIFHSQGGARSSGTVAMMTHVLDWKGTADGLVALDLVRRQRPDVEVVLFGVHDPETAGARFVLRPSRDEVAALLRASTVFVCPSWEEGFGMPGLEAIACGAALATTDTKGSRDYAIDGETALVSQPRRPEALAANIVRLLGDSALRDRLAQAALERVRTYPDWLGAAERFMRAIALATVRGWRNK